jgi:hypothetical protein
VPKQAASNLCQTTTVPLTVHENGPAKRVFDADKLLRQQQQQQQRKSDDDCKPASHARPCHH